MPEENLPSATVSTALATACLKIPINRVKTFS